ncbi:uncharacterized protein LOC131878154 [Tigriopus californicus]|nr:uncharacterized protein LOC131878154 [Tigriopus californicus]
MTVSVGPRSSSPINLEVDALDDSLDFEHLVLDAHDKSNESTDLLLPSNEKSLSEDGFIPPGLYTRVNLNDSMDSTLSSEPAPSKIPMLMGMMFALLANILLVFNNYIIRGYHLNAGELIFVRGFMQVPVCVLIAKCQGYALIPMERFMMVWLILQGLGYSLMVFLCTFAVRLMPVQEFIVLCFTSPIPTIIFSVLLLKERKGVVFKCLLMPILLVGVCLVVKPAVFFPNSDQDGERYPQFTLGVILVVIASIASGISNVCVAKAKSVNSFILMSYMGFATILFSVILLFVPLPNRIIHDFASIPQIELAMTLTSNLISISASLFIVLANKMATPTVTSMFRSTEIPMVVVIELFWFHIYPDLLSIIGSSLVIGCVLLVPHAITISSWFTSPTLLYRKKSSILENSV